MDFWLMNSDGTKQINLSKTLGMQINNAIWYPKFKDTTIRTVQLSSPSNGTTLPFPPGDITFSWNSVSNATKYEFILYNPRGQVVLDTTINRTSLTVPLAGGEDTITWKVRAGDSSGNWGAWSSLWSLTFKSNITTSGETQTDLIKPKIGYLLIETIPKECIIEIPLLNIDKEHEGNKTKKTWEVSAISIGNYRINFIALGKEVKYDLKIEEGVQKHLLVNILNNEVKEILPVLTWDRTYGGNGDDVVFSLIQTTDGGYAIAGGISSKGAGGADFWVIKLDEQGNLKPGVSKLNDEAQTGTEANTTNIQKIPVPSLDSYPQVSENWLNYNEGLALAKKENKYILIYFYTDWCGYCKKMDKETYSKEEVKKILNENFVVVKVNAESDKKVIENGKEITESELSKLYQVSGYPTTWFLESNHSRVAPLPGCVTTEQFISVLNYIGEGWYKSISFQEYLGKI
jgi:thioredoxin-related protein